MTVQGLLDLALQEIDHLGVGFTASNDVYNMGLNQVNHLIGQSNAEGVTLTAVSEDLLTLTGAITYVWGPIGGLTSLHPMKLLSARQNVVSGGVERPVRIVTIDEFDSEARDKNTTGAYLDMIHFDYRFPNGTINVWPTVPSGILYLHSLKPLNEFTAIANVISLPPGTEQYLKLNLAVLLAPLLRRQVTDELRAAAKASKDAMLQANLMALGPQAAIQLGGNR